MTIETQSKSNLYNGNDANTTFPYNYLILDSSHLEVVKRDANGNETTLILDSDYSVSGVGEASGGDVTYPISGDPLATGESLFIKRNVPYLQLVDLLTQGEFSSETIEQSLDYLTMMSLQLKEEIDRAPKVDATTGESGDDLIDNFNQAVTDAQNSATSSASSASASATSASNSATSASNAATSEANAATSEANAAVSEANAASAAASVGAGMYEDVVYKTFADSPITIVDNDRATLFEIDCTGGNVVVNMPSIAGLVTTQKWHIGFKKSDLSANKITINPNGTDEINGNAQEEVLSTHAGTVLIPDVDQTPDQWASLAYGAPNLAVETVNITEPVTEPAFVELQVIGGTTQPNNTVLTNTSIGNYHHYTWTRIGKHMHLVFRFALNDADGNSPASINGGNAGDINLGEKDFIWTLPDGQSFDSSVETNQLSTDQLNTSWNDSAFTKPEILIGTGTWTHEGFDWKDGRAYIVPWDSTRFRVLLYRDEPAQVWSFIESQQYGMGTVGGVSWTIEATFPIQGWTAKSLVIPDSVTLDFDNLNDTPSSYSGQAGKAVVVNQAENALEFQNTAGGVQSYEIFQNPLDFLTNTSSIWELDLSRTQDITESGPSIVTASNPGSATTRFTANQECNVIVTCQANLTNQNTKIVLTQEFNGGGNFQWLSFISGGAINQPSTVTSVLHMQTGDYFEIGPEAIAGTSASANENFGITFKAQAL